MFAGNIFDLGSAQVISFSCTKRRFLFQEACLRLQGLVFFFFFFKSLLRCFQKMVYFFWLPVKTWFQDHGSLMTWIASNPTGSRIAGRRSLSLLCFAHTSEIERPLDKTPLFHFSFFFHDRLWFLLTTLVQTLFWVFCRLQERCFVEECRFFLLSLSLLTSVIQSIL